MNRLTLIYFAKASRIYTGARVNNSRSNVYRGDFRKPKRVNSRMSVCLCECGARIHTSPRLAYCADFRQTGSAGASDLVGMPATSSRLAATLDSVYRKSAAG